MKCADQLRRTAPAERPRYATYAAAGERLRRIERPPCPEPEPLRTTSTPARTSRRNRVWPIRTGVRDRSPRRPQREAKDGSDGEILRPISDRRERQEACSLSLARQVTDPERKGPNRRRPARSSGATGNAAESAGAVLEVGIGGVPWLGWNRRRVPNRSLLGDLARRRACRGLHDPTSRFL